MSSNGGTRVSVVPGRITIDFDGDLSTVGDVALGLALLGYLSRPHADAGYGALMARELAHAVAVAHHDEHVDVPGEDAPDDARCVGRGAPACGACVVHEAAHALEDAFDAVEDAAAEPAGRYDGLTDAQRAAVDRAIGAFLRAVAGRGAMFGALRTTEMLLVSAKVGAAS